MSWIGVDLDGTLAYCDTSREWKGPQDIGPPIPAMVARVKRWLENGQEVRILTARASHNTEEYLAPVRAWCLEHLGCELPIVAAKDHDMIEFWDDRAVQVIPNLGVSLLELVRLQGPSNEYLRF